MYTRLIAFLFLLFSVIPSFGQTFQDALRYSNFDVLGTARTVGVGGALGALGTDFAVMSTNPAGIALNRRSEITFTPSLWLPSTKSTFQNASSPNTQNKNNSFFNINNIGYINGSSSSGFRGPRINFGIGLNRLADFNREFTFEGSNLGSITDDFLAIANGNVGADFFDLDPFGTFLATEALAVYQLDNENFYRTDFEQAPNAQVNKNQTVKETGSINEFVIGFGANFNEKIMVGLNIGIPSIEYQQEKTYQELDPGDDIPQFEELELRENLTTTGAGFNAKVGVIYRLNQALRFGLAVHTPTWFRLDDFFTSDLDYSYLEGNQIFTESGLSPEGRINYQLTTPWRIIGSTGFIIGKRGFLTGEIEYVDFSSAKFKFDDFPQDEPIVNGEIKDELNAAINIRLGGEMVYKSLRFRAGAGLLQSPLVAEDSGFNTTLSAGVGLRKRSYYIDLAYRLFNSTEENYIPITGNPNLPPLVDIRNKDQRSLLMLTLGLRLR